MMHQCSYCLAHVALPNIGLTCPVPRGPRLRRAATDVVERDRPQQHVVFTADQKEWDRITLRNGPLRPIDPVGEAFAAKVVDRPCRLPRAEEIFAVAAQAGPGAEITMLWRPERHPLGFQPDLPPCPQH